MRKFSLILAVILCIALCGCAPRSNVDQEFLQGYQASLAGEPDSTTTLPSQSPADSSNDEFTFSPSDTLDEQGRYEGVTALNYVSLGDYLGIKIPADVHTPTEDAIQEQIDAILDQLAVPEQLTDVVVKDGDAVNIDFVGSVDGVEFEGGNTNGAGTTVIIGETNYIDDFLEQLIGHKPGETINVEVTFPENYGKEDLNGKDAVFVTTINYVEGETIKPEMTDALVSEKFAHLGWSTVDDLRNGICEDISNTQISEYLQNRLFESCTVSEVPEVLTAYQQNSILDYYNTYAQYYSMTLDDFISEAAGFDSREALFDAMAGDIQNSAKSCLIVQAIAEKENITVSDDDITAYFEENGSEDLSTYMEEYGKPYLAYIVMTNRVMDMIHEAAVLE